MAFKGFRTQLSRTNTCDAGTARLLSLPPPTNSVYRLPLLDMADSGSGKPNLLTSLPEDALRHIVSLALQLERQETGETR